MSLSYLCRIVTGCLIAAACIAGRCAAAISATGHWNITLAKLSPENQFERLCNVRILSIVTHPSARLQVQLASGAERDIALSRVLSIGRPSSAPQPRPNWQVLLKDRSRIYGGRPASNGNAFHFSTRFGRMVIPLVDAVGMGRGPFPFGRDRASSHDTLYFTDGQRLKGTFMSAAASGVCIKSSLGTASIPWDRVRRLELGGLPYRATHAPDYKIVLDNRSILMARRIEMRGDTLEAELLIGVTLRLAPGAIDKIDVLRGRVRRLSSLQPSAYRQQPLFGAVWPLMVNENALGRSIKVGQRRYRHGIGLHAPATITYDLHGRFAWLVLAPAMDDSAATSGHGSIQIRADGQIIYSSGDLITGQPVKFIKLPLANAKWLTIRAMSPSPFATRSRIDLLRPCLILK